MLEAFPSSDAAMEPSKDQKKITHDAILELASRIYVELAVRSTSVSEHGVKLTASADNLAKVAFGLAEAFHSVEDERDEANRPKTGFSMNSVDLASWSKG